MSFKNINFANCDFTFKGTPEVVDKHGYGEWDYITSSAGFYIANAENVSLNNVQVHIEDKNSKLNKGVIETDSSVRYIGFIADIDGEIIDRK